MLRIVVDEARRLRTAVKLSRGSFREQLGEKQPRGSKMQPQLLVEKTKRLITYSQSYKLVHNQYVK